MLDLGRTLFEGPAAEILQDPRIQELYLARPRHEDGGECKRPIVLRGSAIPLCEATGEAQHGSLSDGRHPQILVLGLALGGVYALMASGLTLIFGVMRIVNLAHPIMIIGGAYVSYWLFKLYGLDPILSMPIAFIVLFCVGIVLYKLVFEREAASAKYSEMTVLLTFAVAMCFDGLLGALFTNTQRGTTPRYGADAFIIDSLGIFIPKGQLYAGIASLVVIGALFLFLRYSRFGYAIRATTQNRAAAQLMGVNVGFVSLSPSASASGSPAPPAR